jgi:hypothetical protein
LLRCCRRGCLLLGLIDNRWARRDKYRQEETSNHPERTQCPINAYRKSEVLVRQISD